MQQATRYTNGRCTKYFQKSAVLNFNDGIIDAVMAVHHQS